jgi:DNA-binding NtrC family response regulator
MPARIVVVHDQPEFLNELATGLRQAGHHTATFADPLAAWDALETARQIEVLITRVQYAPGRSNGLALARMARSKRPGIRVVFTALPQYADQVDEQDTFMAMPVRVPEVIDAVNRLLEGDANNPR